MTGAISLHTSDIAFIMITLASAQMGYFLAVSPGSSSRAARARPVPRRPGMTSSVMRAA